MMQRYRTKHGYRNMVKETPLTPMIKVLVHRYMKKHGLKYASSLLGHPCGERHLRDVRGSELTMYDQLAREESRQRISQLTSQLQNVKFELEDLQTENSRLKTKQRDFEEALIKSDGSLNYTRERADEEMEIANRKIADLNSLIRDLEHERRELQLGLNTSEESFLIKEKELMKRERMRRNLQSKLSHLISMLHATLPGIKVNVPRIKLTLNDEGDSTDVEYTDTTTYNKDNNNSFKYNNDGGHSPLPTDENSIDVESVRQAILHLKKHATIHENDCRDFKSELQKLRDSNHSNKDKISRLTRDNNLLSEKVAGLDKEKSGYRDQLDTAHGSLQTVEESRKGLQNQLEISEKKREELTYQQQHVDRLNEQLKSKLAQLEIDISESEKSRNTANNEIDNLITKFEMVKKHKDQVEVEKNSANKQFRDMIEEKTVLERRLEHIHNTLEESEKEKSALQLNITKLHKSSSCTQDKLKTLEDNMLDLEKRLGTYKEENHTLKQSLSSTNTENSSIRENKLLLEDAMTKVVTDKETLNNKITELQDKLSKVQDTATDNEMLRIKVEGQVRSANLSLQQKCSELRTNNNKLDLVSNDNKHLQNNVANLTAKVNQIDRENRAMSEKFVCLETDNKLLKQSKLALDKEVNILQETIRNRENELRDLENKYNSVSNSHEKNKRQLKKLEALLEGTEEGSKTRLQRLDDKYREELEREMALNKDRNMKLLDEKSRSEDLRKKINELQDQIATLNVTIHRQEATKKSYQDRIDTKIVENRDLRSLLNETYNINGDMTQLYSKTSRRSPEPNVRNSPDYRSRDNRSPDFQSSPIRRQRSISPVARRRSISPVRRKFESPTPTSSLRSTHRVHKHEDTDNSAPQNRDDTLIDFDNSGLKCMRCKSPIGLTLA